MKYQIISENGFSHKKIVAKLTTSVNNAIELGWEPIGGIVVAGTHYCQTLAKKRT